MRRNLVKYTVAAFVLCVLGILLTPLIASYRMERRWFDVQDQQLATILRLGDFPPPGWQPAAWQSELITLYNVWGNVTYTPSYRKSHIC